MTVSTADLSGELTLKSRDEVVADYLEAYQVRTGSTIVVAPKTQPWVDAQVVADVVAPLYGNTQVIADGTSARTARGARLEAIVAQKEIERLPAAGSTGYVSIIASTGGTTILAGDELVDLTNTIRFQCAVSGTYFQDLGGVPISAITKGPVTNLDAGVQLKWVSPRPGCGPIATVKESFNGKGLTGGRNEETDDELATRYEQSGASQAASGNDAEYQLRTEKTPDVPVSKAFTYPSIKGPGTTAVVFTVRPDRPGGERRPTNVQIAAAEGHVVGLMPADDGAFYANLLQQAVTVAIRVEWVPTTEGWVDFTPWPAYAQGMVVSGVSSATKFTVSGTGTAPTAGKTFALYNLNTGTFARKRIAAVSGSGPWDLTIDTTNDSSDVSYVPTVGQFLCPWSRSLDLLVPTIVAYFEQLGPGEMVSSFYDEGVRQRRNPVPPAWPNTIKNKVIDQTQDLSSVSDAVLLSPVVPYATTVGVPGTTAYLLELGDFVAFAS